MGGAEPRYTVRLRGDARLLVEQDKYLSELQREYQLLRAGQMAGAALATQDLLREVDELLIPYSGFRRALRAAGDLALAGGRGEGVAHLELSLDAVEAARRYLALMRRSWQLSEEGKLLTMPPSPQLRRFQESMAAQVERELLAAIARGDTAAQHPPRRRGEDFVDEDAEHLLVWFDEPAPPGPRIARRRLGELLASWGREELLDEAELAATELLTNAFLHAPGPVLVHVSPSGPGVRIAVSDSSPSPPLAREPDVDTSTGRGLVLIAAMAKDWGYQTRPDGKTVWAEFWPASALANVRR